MLSYCHPRAAGRAPLDGGSLSYPARSMARRVPLGAGGIQVHEWAGIRLPSVHEMDAAPGRRDTAFPPVWTRDTRYDMARIGIDALEPSEPPR